jgi:hypothetical protein
MTTATMTMTSATPTSPLVDALKTARGRMAGVMITRADGRQIAKTTDGDVWVTIDCPDDGTVAGDELHACVVPPAPAMGTETFACTLRWACLEQIVRGIVPATDTESSRYALGGVQIECREGSMLAAIGTDGRRLHVAHLQPASIAGETPQYCVVPTDAWKRVASVARAAVRAVRGLTGRKAADALRAGVVTIQTDGTVVCLTWGHAGLSVTATARLIEGRFPRWRDVVDPHAGVGEGLAVRPEDVGGAAADCVRSHKAAVAAGKAAWLAEPLPAGASKRKAGAYEHDRGVWLRRDGMTGRGCDWTSSVAGAPAEVCLDPAFVVDAMTAAALFGRTAIVRQADDRKVNPVAIEAGGEFGERMVAVIMPLAIDC